MPHSDCVTSFSLLASDDPDTVVLILLPPGDRDGLGSGGERGQHTHHAAVFMQGWDYFKFYIVSVRNTSH